MKKIVNYVRHNSESVKETIEYAYIVCAMLLMFMGSTGAIASVVSLLIVVISANIGGDNKRKEDKEKNSIKRNTSRCNNKARYNSYRRHVRRPDYTDMTEIRRAS